MYTKLTRAISLQTTTAAVVTYTFLDSWVFLYGIPSQVLTNNGRQFVSSFFDFVNMTLGIGTTTTTASHPQTNGEAKLYSQRLASRLRHFASENQSEWYENLQTLPYAYNLQVYRFTLFWLNSLLIIIHPPSILTACSAVTVDVSSIGDRTRSSEEKRLRILTKLRSMLEWADRTMSMKQQS